MRLRILGWEMYIGRGYCEDVFGCSEEELELLLDWRDNVGRPNLMEQWVARIEGGEATLDDAREDVSRPTFYKIRDAIR